MFPERNMVLKQGYGCGDGEWGTGMVANRRDRKQGCSLEGEENLEGLGLSGWGDGGPGQKSFPSCRQACC